MSSEPEHPTSATDKSSNPPPIDYYPLYAPGWRLQDWRVIWIVDALMMPKDAEQRRWWGRRLLYYISVFVFFLVIVFYVGPNEIMFGKVMYPYHSIADYVPEVTTECVPIVRAMKEFDRDHGRLPGNLHEIVPQYLPSVHSNAAALGDALFFVKGDHLISYDFTPATEGWTVLQGRFIGALPAPLVRLAPSTRPTALPATGG